MRRAAGRRGVRNEVERIGDAGVLSFRSIVEIGDAREGVENDVLHHRAEALGCGEDFGLGFFRELDRLGVAAAFEVEDAVLRPAVLVVAEQRALGVGRQRRLAGARQAEEDGRIVLVADIGRAMHRHDVVRGQDEVEIGEDRLLHLAGVARAADQNDLAREVDRDDGLGAAAVALGIGAERRQVDDSHVGHERCKLAALRPDQHRADEQRVPRIFGKDPGLHAERLIGAAIKILREKFLALGVLDEIGEQRVEIGFRHLAVVVPPHGVGGDSIVDDELVLGRAASVLAGLGDERAALGDHRLATLHRFLVEERRIEIVGDLLEVLETEFVRRICGIEIAQLFHAFLPIGRGRFSESRSGRIVSHS